MRLAAVVLLLALTVLNPALATPTDFNFKDVEVGNICSTIGVLGKFNVIVCADVARARLVFSARQVEPLDALMDVAKQANLQVCRVPHEEGTTTTTFMVGRPEHMQSVFGKSTRTVQLKYASAAHVARTLGERMEALLGSKAAIDERTNRLVLTGTPDAIARVGEILVDVDLPVPQAEVQLSVVTGPGTLGTPQTPAGKAQPLWNGTAVAMQGRVAKLDVSVTGAPRSPAWRLCNLEGKLTARVNSDNFMGVELNIAATFERNGVKSGVRWATELQVADGEQVAAGTVEVAPGETMSLLIKPTVIKQSVVVERSAGPPVDPSISQECDLDLSADPKPAVTPGTPERGPVVPSPAPPPPSSGGDLDLEGI